MSLHKFDSTNIVQPKFPHEFSFQYLGITSFHYVLYMIILQPLIFNIERKIHN